MKDCKTACEELKAKLLKKAKKSGITENFGQKEYQELSHRYDNITMGSCERRNNYDQYLKPLAEWIENLDLDL